MDTGERLGRRAARRLAELGTCDIAPGLTPREFDEIEAEFGFRFADDHRAFLAAGLPVRDRAQPRPGVIHTWDRPWPDWRHGRRRELRDQLAFPVTNLLGYVGAGVWLPGWGPRPATNRKAKELVRELLAGVPAMVPVHGHRCLPGGHGTSGHPVLSMWGPDIIVYGTDLDDYVRNDFGDGTAARAGIPADGVTVPFWRDFLAAS